MLTLKRKLSESTIFLRNLVSLKPKIGLTLGSGLSEFAERLEQKVSFPFEEIPHFLPSRVQGHKGHLVFGLLKGVPVAILQGRVHAYEGHSAEQVVFPTRVLAELGIKTLLLTNAAGGLDPQQSPGDFLLITDHINLTGLNPLVGANDDQLGPRFVDMTQAYDSDLVGILRQILVQSKHPFHEGPYCGVLGPSYETAAEIRYLGHIGGKAVGMSTVLECIAARHMGVRVAGLSCITNLGTGLSPHKVTHDEVQAVAQKVSSAFEFVVEKYVQTLASLGPA